MVGLVADPIALVAAIGVPVASALIAIGVYLGKRNEAPPVARDAINPQAPTRQPSLHDLDGATLSAKVDEHGRRLDEHARKIDLIDSKGDEILRSLARQEGAEEERRRQRAERAARQRGDRGPGEST